MSTPLYAGVLSQGTGVNYLWNVGTWDGLVQKWNELNAGKLRLTGVNSGQLSETDHWFIGVWNELGGEDALWRTSDWNFFYSKFEAGQVTMRLLDFDIVTIGLQRWYIGCWGGSPIKQELIHDVTWDAFVAKWKQLSTQANPMRLVKIQVYSASLAVGGIFGHSNEPFHITGLFEAGSGGYSLYSYTDKNEFLQQYNTLEGSQQLTDFDVFHSPNGKTYYIGVWRETTQKHYFLHDLRWDDFVNSRNTLNAEGYHLQKAIRYSA